MGSLLVILVILNTVLAAIGVPLSILAIASIIVLIIGAEHFTLQDERYINDLKCKKIRGKHK